jgi:hypothetical protein
MRIIKELFLFLFLIFFFSCEEQGLLVNCKDCLNEEPLETNLEIKIDMNIMGMPILIKVYEGNIEDSALYCSIYGSGEYERISVLVNKKYTVIANYYIPPDNYIAFDSATPRVRYVKELCSDPCYFVYDKVVNLRIKYVR